MLSASQSPWTNAHDWPGISLKFEVNLLTLIPFILCDNCIIRIQGEKDDKIIAVCVDDPEYKHYTDIKDLPPHRLTEIRRFFEDCILFNLKL